LKVSRYISVVCTAFTIDFVCLLLIDSIYEFDRVFVSSYSYFLGSLVSFFLMKKFVFIEITKNKNSLEFVFYIASGALMAILTGIIFFIANIIGIENIIIQKIFASLISFSTLYFIRKNYIFR